ncbi:hypothetical protein JTE90_024195 [Oedothorax gibbosus]|uniref:DNA-directed DNA polymerase n=1 Tax=Oedothorax gibbosus TaxID=931172 RepID=A0AAV6U1Z8_9ARAC|nr:hypothetical protein JTE90_024195 [Oedothorax gibbosus]
MWEHSFTNDKKTNAALKNFISSLEVVDRLNPRDAFFGGRTNAIKLYHEGPSKYIDFTSLYPWCNKYASYPVGHPEIITPADGKTGIEEYFGIIKWQGVTTQGALSPCSSL